MTKKSIYNFLDKNGVTPSVAAPDGMTSTSVNSIIRLHIVLSDARRFQETVKTSLIHGLRALSLGLLRVTIP